MGVVVFALIVVAVLLGYFLFKGYKTKQLTYIQGYQFPKKVLQRVEERYPHLTKAEVLLVVDALRDYFHICNQSRGRMVAMPSQAVDLAWHEFILFTRNYQSFCRKGIGRFLHHTPTEAMINPTFAQDGIKRAWRLACAKEKIDPALPTRLPLLFGIDAMLKIDDGFQYSLNCQDRSKPGYVDGGFCAGHIGCASGCGGSSGSAAGDSGGFFDGFGDFGGSGCGGD